MDTKNEKRLAPPFELNPDYHGGCGRPLQQPRTCVILEEFGSTDISRAYCESDVLNTYRVWLRYELFRGRLSEAQSERSWSR